MHGPTSHTYFSQRLRLHYVDWGNPDAPPMILIHGGRDHCRNWDWVAEQFRDDYHIIKPGEPEESELWFRVTSEFEDEIMPPKSTWFEPKLRSGLFVHEFERVDGAKA